MPRVVVNRQTYLTLQATSMQRTDSSLMTILQQTTMLRVVAGPQVESSPIAKNARPCKHNTSRLVKNANHTPEKGEARMIFGGPREVGSGGCVRDRFSKKAKKPPQTVVHTAGSKPLIGYVP